MVQLACAHWFFGNLYEAIVRVPHRVAGNPEPAFANPARVLVSTPGSPIRYFLPGLPVLAAGLIIAATTADRSSTRRWVALSAACSIAGGGLTAYLVRTVNLKLFVSGHPLTPDDRQTMLDTWYRLNWARLLAAGAAAVAAHMAWRDLHGLARFASNVGHYGSKS